MGEFHRNPAPAELAAALRQSEDKKRDDLLRVLRIVADAGDYGVTAYELKRDWSPPWINTPAARLTNLKEMGLVIYSGDTRPTNTGCAAHVHIASRLGYQVLDEL